MKEENKRADRILDTAKAESAGSVNETKGKDHPIQRTCVLGTDDSTVIPCMSCSHYTYYGCTRSGSCRLLASWQDSQGQYAS